MQEASFYGRGAQAVLWVLTGSAVGAWGYLAATGVFVAEAKQSTAVLQSTYSTFETTFDLTGEAEEQVTRTAVAAPVFAAPPAPAAVPEDVDASEAAFRTHERRPAFAAPIGEPARLSFGTDKAEPPACLAGLQHVAEQAWIAFEADSAMLDRDSVARLRGLAQAANACPEAALIVTGYAAAVPPA